MKGDTSDADGAGRGKIDALNCSSWSKLDNIPRRDSITDHVELFFVKAMGLEYFVNLICTRLVRGEET